MGASIHGTHSATVSENVAYDVVGYCYYLEDGVETKNTISFNLAAHIHMLFPDMPPTAQSQFIEPIYSHSENLTLPADVTASGYYITNLDNYIAGNTASGGWSGFAIPILPAPVGLNRNINLRPSSARGLVFDGNTAHSTGWWWSAAGAFYFGGTLYYEENGHFESDSFLYNAGRDLNVGTRSVCQDPSANFCFPSEYAWILVTNTKAYLTRGAAFNSWSGRMEVIRYEAHDVGLSLNALENGFWIDNMLVVCRTGEPMALPPSENATRISGDGFYWYDAYHSVQFCCSDIGLSIS